MKIDSHIWFETLCQFKLEKGSSQNIFEFVKASNLKEFDFLEIETPYSDTLRDFSEKLAEIDLENNSQLKKLFFNGFNTLPYEDKSALFKNDDLIDINVVKKYFIKNILNYPTIHELYRFRKNLDEATIQEGLQTIFKNTPFYTLNNNKQNKEDYWDNHLSGKDINKLLTLVEMANFKKESAEDWNKIGILNTFKQVKLDFFINKAKDKEFITTTDTSAFIIYVSMNLTTLIEKDKNISVIHVNNTELYMKYLFNNAIGLDNIKLPNKEKHNELNYIAYDYKLFTKAIDNRNTVIHWLENNIDFLADMAKKRDDKNFDDINNEMKQLSEKILLKNGLETNLIEKNSLKLTSKL